MRLYKYIISILAVLNCLTAYAQMASPPRTHALIIGVANYGNPDIPKLKFANRDAEAFARFLKSNAGGSVPEENIILLVDTAATTAAVYNAIDELGRTVKKGDLVYFYFSGHGDIENKTIYKNGFLICYDSPPTNYNRFSLSIDDLNETANTMSADLNANVVLITDACHSGKLAGSFNKGNFLAGERFRQVKKKEIRITSSSAEQLSNENEAWGGGRGVFSWYLINGLNGLADQQNDGTVTLDEIKKFLDSSLAKDPVLIRENLVQTPVLQGNPAFALAQVDAAIKQETELATGVSPDMVSTPSPQTTVLISLKPQAYFFQLLKAVNLEKILDTLSLENVTDDKLPFIFINALKENEVNGSMQRLSEPGIRKLEELEQMLRSDEGALKRFNNKLAVALDEKGQIVIDQYLRGDEAELERRRYYNKESSGYGIYPKLFTVAIRLTQPASYLRKNLEVKLHYFTGVTYRLLLPTVEDKIPIIEKAMKEQKKAMSLVDNAPYIFNELGLLYWASNKLKDAESYFNKAIDASPTWVIPRTNLVGLYTRMKKYDQAMKQYDSALVLDPGYQGIYLRAGVLYGQTGNLLVSEELLRKYIGMNSRHYFSFDQLGFIYTNTAQYALADSFFYEGELRKRGFRFRLLADADGDGVSDDFDMENLPTCEFDTRLIREDDPIGQAAWGIRLMLNEKNYVEAEKHLKKAILLDRKNPIAYHYLGKIQFEGRRWREAEINLKYALQYHLDSAVFYSAYRDSIGSSYKTAPDGFFNCLLSTYYFNAWYKKRLDHFYLGSLYEKWGHLSEAAEQYSRAIPLDEKRFRGYYKLWNVWEKLGRYSEAEQVILGYRRADNFSGQNELYGFYNRMISRFPDDGNWYYKYGKLLYDLALVNHLDERITQYDLDFKEAAGLGFYKEQEIDLNPGFTTYSIDTDVFPQPGDTLFNLTASRGPYCKMAIASLKKADSLLRADDDTHAEIYEKIGDLYTLQGLPYPASSHYQVAVDARPDNASVREKLADAYSASYQLSKALAQLDSLLSRKQVDFPKQVMMARYLVHCGNFEKAQQLLTEAEKEHPYPIAEIFDLKGLLFLRNNQADKAMNVYSQKLEIFPGDNITMYNIAKVYARTGKYEQAKIWLDKALHAGFNYPYVLKNDQDFNGIRNSPRWEYLNKAIKESFGNNSNVRYLQFRHALLEGKDWFNFIK